jgi:choline kinase
MKTIIIAAGKGQRISNKFKDIPKSLIPINSKTIFERQKNVFKNKGILDLIVITGAENKFKDVDVTYVQDKENEKHDILGSLLVAKEYIKDELIISYSDIIFEDKILQQLLDTEGDIVIAIDLNWKKAYEGRTEHPLSEAENVLLNEKNQIIEIKKNIQNETKKVGEFLGLIKMSKTGSKIFLDKINNLQKKHIGKFHNAISLEKGYLTDMIQEIVNSSIEITPSFISGKWCEIDTKQDYERATKNFR